MRRVLLILLALTLASPLTAADQQPLTKRERKDAVAKLGERHRQFLMDVEPIMVPTERDTFLRLETDPQRDAFIDDFWRRRDQAKGTTNFATRDEYYDWLEFVKENFGQVSSDRGRIYLTQGPPLAITDVKCPRFYQPTQVWRYERLTNFGSDYRILFYIPHFQTEYRLWNPMDPNAYNELISKDIEASGQRSSNPALDCPKGDELMAAMSMMQMDSLRITKLFEPPPVNGEDVNRILRSVVLADPNAPKLTAEISVAYPSGDGKKTDAQLTILVPKGQLKTTTAGEATVYTLDVVGEVLRDEKLWEKYRYRFDFPVETQAEKLPIVIDRLLRPSQYLSRIKISDPVSKAEAILETPIVVPEIDTTRSFTPTTEETKALGTIQDDLQSTRATLRIVPLNTEENGGVTSGVQTIQTLASGSGIKSVEFWLDGKKIATRRNPPYTLDLDFGTVPRLRRIRVVALDSHGQTVTGDEIVVNTGTDPFRVRIAAPRVAPKVTGPTKVEIDVRVPEGKELNAVELYWNETRVATMYDPPFIHTVQVPKTEGVGYLRAVASLKEEGTDPVEDVVMVNSPDYMETIDVHLVELPTTVLRDGKPVNDLTEAAFQVLDDGKPVKLAKFEYVKNLPLSIGMAVDTSGSMDERMATARDTGAAFFQNVLRKGDKAFLVAFDSQPHMIQKWSGELHDIHSGLARLRPEESTALYDAVVYSLYNFLGMKGQKALVLLTDGKDTISKFTYEQALEYAQRAAVPIYAIGLGIRTTDIDVKHKLNKLCAETGGTAYYIDDAKDLTRIYTDIENELRSQYILGFYPPSDVKSGGKWREVSVDVAEGKVKTIRGYYP
ncbi:MAG TPA: VWA domain-containing protein [Thermoanaerobaculia bacterium]|nr:VWA domain-containing protein [Thermoanaerobaculia bacterium]